MRMCNRHDHIAVAILLGDGGFDMQIEIGANSTNIASEWPSSHEPAFFRTCGLRCYKYDNAENVLDFIRNTFRRLSKNAVQFRSILFVRFNCRIAVLS